MPTEPTTTIDILMSLGMAVFVPGDGDTLIPIGELPHWWIHVDPEGGRQAPCFRPSSRQVFLAHFLEEAKLFFQEGTPGVCDSGIWEHEVDEDTRYYFHVRAIRLADESTYLVIQDLESSGVDFRQVIQHGRDAHMRALKDIARREQLANELRRAQAESERLNRLKTELLGKVSHELRTPLTSIMGLCELALGEDPSRNIQDRLHDIRDASKHLKRLVDDLLDTAALESGMLGIRNMEFDLPELLQSLRPTYQAIAKERGLEFDVQLAEDLLQTRVRHGDPDRLKQVLSNLLENAIRYTTTGSVKLLVNPNPGDSDVIRFSVIDTGPGIPWEDQTAIFDPFVQSQDSSESTESRGTGLGLAIVQRLVVGMGGTVSLESTPRQGTIFRLDIPLQGTPADPMGAKDRAGEDEALRQDAIPAVNRSLRILIADDNRVNRKFLADALTTQGHSVVQAAHGLEAVEQVQQQVFDLAILDCRMPYCDGFEATMKIRQFERTRGSYLPIIALTANAGHLERDKCLAAGMDSYLSKPYTIDELCNVINQLAAKRIVPWR